MERRSVLTRDFWQTAGETSVNKKQKRNRIEPNDQQQKRVYQRTEGGKGEDQLQNIIVGKGTRQDNGQQHSCAQNACRNQKSSLFK